MNEPPPPHDPEELIRNIQRLMDEVEAIIARCGAAPAEGEPGRPLEALGERLASVRQKARGLGRAARERMAVGALRADEAVRGHPYESVAVALGVGLLVGAYLRRPGD
jgi:ElaB/YqjD/DUF883 family membrane-anchored ribosome-binding protein